MIKKTNWGEIKTKTLLQLAWGLVVENQEAGGKPSEGRDHFLNSNK